MTPKIVFLDMDGTLCNRDGVIPDSAWTALRRARENGHQMVLCTGRCKAQLFPWLDPEDFDGVVSVAGSCVTCGDTVVYQKCMEREPLRKMVAYFRSHNMPYFLQSEEAIYTESWSLAESRQALLDLGRTPDQIKDVFGNIILREDPEEAPKIEKALYYRCMEPASAVDAALDHAFTITDSSFKVTRFCDGEITCRGITKAAGMQHYLDFTGFSREDTIAVGDGPNDFEMIDFANIGVAMGNGEPSLKARADYVTTHIEDDGIFNAFSHLGLL